MTEYTGQWIRGQVSGGLCLGESAGGVALLSEGGSGMLLMGETYSDLKDILPQREITVSGWVSQEESQEWGGLLGYLQDNADYEKGWLLGSRKGQACLAIASKDRDDGDGNLTYLAGGETMKPGQWYHIAGTYDGQRMVVYLNGKQVAASEEQSGDILYSQNASFVLLFTYDKQNKTCDVS